MNQETATYFQELNKAHLIEINIKPKPKENSPLFIVNDLELAIFKKHIILALKEIEKERI